MSSPEMQQSVDVDVPQGVDGHSPSGDSPIPSGDSPIPSGDSPIPSSDLLTSSSDSPIKILVVDDEVDLEALVLQKFRRQIRKGELAFSFAHNGKEAIEKLDEDPEIAMVLSDINMPVMDGLALLKQLSETKPEIRAVIVSAYGDMSNIRTAMNRGAFDFVTKPIDFGDLQITIDKTLKHLRLMKDALASRDQLVALNSELDVARQMQAAALPARCSSTDFYDFNAVMVPAKEVGGDFYDLIRMSEKRIGVAIGDVSGKGVPAALFTMATRTLLRSYAMGGDPPHQCLNKVNELLCEDNDMCMFVTLFYAVLDAENGVLHYCNGGHNLPRIVRNDGRVEVLHATRNVALGVVAGHEFQHGQIELQADDSLFLYTDGVTEAEGPNAVEFGETRLDELLAHVDGGKAENITSRTLDEVEEFTRDIPQSDDITCVTLMRRGESLEAVGA